MRTPDYVIGPGGTVPPDIEDADLLAATIAAEPVLILLPHAVATQIGDDGTLLAEDVFEAAIRAHGAQPLTDLKFLSPPRPEWLITIDAAAAAVRITGPGVLCEVYTGSLPPVGTAWLDRVAEKQRHGHGIVLITGFATPTTALDMIAAGRASWVRTPVAVISSPGAGGTGE
ncbi:hypothetical protein ACL02S_22315 [Nocardia sp. 004]|uniref:hypothetical protein n=1 Tax=Nocardia sp. 004 TaxID=3385978 RepID=UPI0039A354B6